MPLTDEQIKDLKKQLSEQIKQLPEDQRAEAQKQIDSMSAEALEAMVEQQKAQNPGNEKIFRAIVEGKIPSKQIDENKHAIAVLDIKPISKGHTVIIPKKPCTDAKDIPSQALTLAKKVAKKLVSKLKAEGTEIQTQFLFGEIIINIIPVYDQSLSINSPRQEVKQEELEDLYILLRKKTKPKVIRKTTKKSKEKDKVIKLKRRIP